MIPYRFFQAQVQESFPNWKLISGFTRSAACTNNQSYEIGPGTRVEEIKYRFLLHNLRKVNFIDLLDEDSHLTHF